MSSNSNNNQKKQLSKPFFRRKSEKTESSKFAIIEGYKNARANLMFSLSTNENNCFAVTSWSKGEGKSTAAANLAISFSKTEQKVLLIDCDLRRPSAHILLKLLNQNGLSNILAKKSAFEEVVHKDVYPNLDILTSGTIPPNPSELMCSNLMPELIEKVSDLYDYVIFDTPPIGVVADALLLKKYVSGFVMIIKERNTTHGDIKKALEIINQVEAKLLGFLKVGCHKKYKKDGKQSANYYSSYY